MIAKKSLYLSNLTKTQAFCIHDAAKVFVISKNKNFVLAIFERLLPYLKDVNIGQKLIIVSFVSSFDWDHFI